MPRLRRVSASTPGWRRSHAGRGLAYTDVGGAKLNPADVARVRSLAIPPAWRDVWICPDPNGHLQATGFDAAGRRQYLYHPHWRTMRDTAKFARIAQVASRLPKVRKVVADHLEREGMPFERAVAVAFRLLDLGYFRIGSDLYADQYGSFGLTTLERRHARRDGDGIVFSFVGKSGISHRITITDPMAIQAIDIMRRRRGAGTRLLAYRNGHGWTDLRSSAVNTFLGQHFDAGFTAKDFRTWHATVIAAEALATTDEPATTLTSRRRAVKAAVIRVSDYLGNTPTVAKSSYIDPRIIDLYEEGTTIKAAATRSYPTFERRRSALEAAVLKLLAS